MTKQITDRVQAFVNSWLSFILHVGIGWRLVIRNEDLWGLITNQERMAITKCAEESGDVY